MKIARIATVPFFLQSHLRGQIRAIAAAGHEVALISSDGPEVADLATIPGVRFHGIEIPRKIAPFRDLIALWALTRLFRREQYDIVHSTTPKAGLLTAIAGWLAGVPVRMHTFTGQVWMEKRGVTRYLAKTADRLTAALNTQCYADSSSQRDFIVAEGVAAPQQIKVLEAGSLAGVELHRFDPERWRSERHAIRAELRIDPGVIVISFIGRMTRDKGIQELVTAFQMLRRDGVECVLLLVGPRDPDWHALSPEVRHAMGHDPAICCVGYSNQPERYLAISDVFCLPSYREGFGNVAIEAAAMGVPAIGTDIVGLRDAIVGGKTGLLVPPKDANALAGALATLMTDPELRRSMGEQGRLRATAQFDARRINAAVIEEYEKPPQRFRRDGEHAGENNRKAG